MRLVDSVSHISVYFLKDESGASLIEGVLVASLVAVVVGLFLMAFNKNA